MLLAVEGLLGWYMDVEGVSPSEVAKPGSVSRDGHDMGDCDLAEFLALTQRHRSRMTGELTTACRHNIVEQ
jgi:hypothetical protein